ncbi:MAG: 30S ribosomal protein S21 [Candidatus Komeilibacteria bacterium]
MKRKEGESFESLLRRFTRKTIQSGKILQAKKIRFHQKPKTKRELKESALRREDTKQKRDYLKRIGRLDETLEKKKKFGRR